jgi:hypothetical protein
MPRQKKNINVVMPSVEPSPVELPLEMPAKNAKKRALKKKEEQNKKEESSSSSSSRCVMVNGLKHFNALDLARYNLAQNKIQNSLKEVGFKELEIRNMQLEFEKLQMTYEKKVQQLIKERENLHVLALKEQGDLKKLQEELAEAYDINFSKPISYDDETGRITLLAP